MKQAFLRASLLMLSICSLNVIALEPKALRLVLFSRGETILGEEFIAANEQVVDYINSLKRPTEAFKTIRYNCLGKSRRITPYLQNNPVGATSTPWVEIRTVYELKDCVEARD